MSHYACITGWGKYLPQKVLTNDDLSRMVDTSDEWITTRTGIKERRLAAQEETTASMITRAAVDALALSGLAPEDLDLIIVGTNSPDFMLPASSFLVQHALGARKAAAFDVAAGCSAFISGLTIASQFISTGTYKNILVGGGEVMSRILDWNDRSTCILFGDGAAAMVVQAGDKPGILSCTMGADGSEAGLIYVPGVCGSPLDPCQNGKPYVHMKGKEVFRHAVTRMTEAARQVVAAAGLQLSDINLFIPHQANQRIIQSVVKSLKVSPERVFINVGRYGNVSAASPAIALCEAVEEGKLNYGDHVVMAAFGAGLSWGAVAIRWNSKNIRPEI